MAAELQLNTLRIEGTELLDALVTSVFLLDQDLHVCYLNAAAQTLLGLGPNQALGRRVTELTAGLPKDSQADAAFRERLELAAEVLKATANPHLG